MILDVIIIGLFISNIALAFKNNERHAVVGWVNALCCYIILIIKYGF
jgi:hypothetical protein